MATSIDWERTSVIAKQSGHSEWDAGVVCDRTFRRRTDDHDVLLITRGTGRMTMERGWVDLMPGRCLWLTPGPYYEAEQDPANPLAMHWVHFDLYDKKTIRPYDAPRPREVIDPPDVPLIDALLRRVAALSGFNARGGVDGDPLLRTHAGIALKLVLVELDTASAGSHEPRTGGTPLHHAERVLEVEQAIHAHPERDLTVEAMADIAGYSPEHFARVFRKLTGHTPRSYVIRTRLHRAMHLLVQTGMSIEQIANQLGYQESFYFIRQFKQKTGMTPRQYRVHRLEQVRTFK